MKVLVISISVLFFALSASANSCQGYFVDHSTKHFLNKHQLINQIGVHSRASFLNISSVSKEKNPRAFNKANHLIESLSHEKAVNTIKLELIARNLMLLNRPEEKKGVIPWFRQSAAKAIQKMYEDRLDVLNAAKDLEVGLKKYGYTVENNLPAKLRKYMRSNAGRFQVFAFVVGNLLSIKLTGYPSYTPVLNSAHKAYFSDHILQLRRYYGDAAWPKILKEVGRGYNTSKFYRQAKKVLVTSLVIVYFYRAFYVNQWHMQVYDWGRDIYVRQVVEEQYKEAQHLKPFLLETITIESNIYKAWEISRKDINGESFRTNIDVFKNEREDWIQSCLTLYKGWEEEYQHAFGVKPSVLNPEHQAQFRDFIKDLDENFTTEELYVVFFKINPEE